MRIGLAAVLVASSTAFSINAMATTLEQAEFSKSESHGPVAFTSAELAAHLGKVQQFIDHANATKSGEEVPHGTVQISDGTTTSSFPTKSPVQQYRSVPSGATEIRFHYSNYKAPISEVWYYLNDLERKINVKGTNPNQVEGLVGLVASDIDQYRVLVGGFVHRFIGGIGIGIIGLILLLAFHDKVPDRLSGLSAIAILLCLPVSMLAAFWPVLPGAVVYWDESSFWERNDYWLTILGLAVGLFSIILSWNAWQNSKRPQQE